MFKDFREICVNNNLLNYELNFFIISRGAIKPYIIAAPYQGALNLAKRSQTNSQLKRFAHRGCSSSHEPSAACAIR